MLRCGRVELVVAARVAVDGRAHPGGAGRRRPAPAASAASATKKVLAPGHVQHEAQARAGAGGVHREDRLPRDVDQRSARGGDRRLALDLDPHLALEHREPLARVGMESRALRGAGRGGDVFAGEPAVVEQALAPARLAAVSGLDVGQLDPRPHAGRVAGQRRRLRRPDRGRHRRRSRDGRRRGVLCARVAGQRESERGSQGDAHARIICLGRLVNVAGSLRGGTMTAASVASRCSRCQPLVKRRACGRAFPDRARAAPRTRTPAVTRHDRHRLAQRPSRRPAAGR